MASDIGSRRWRQWFSGVATGVGAVQRRAAAFTRHHGAWAPGVRLLRNLSLRAKALTLAVCIGIPVAVLLAQTWRYDAASFEAAAEREQLLQRLQGLEVLARSASQLQALALAAELGQPDRPRWQAALQADQAAYAAFAARLQPLRADRAMQGPIDALQARHDALLAVAGNESTRGVPGFGGPRLEALSDYARQLTVLGRVLGRGHSAWAAAPAPVRALHELHVGALQRLRWLLDRGAAIGAASYEGEGRATRGERLQLLMLEARVVGDDVELELRQAVAQGLVGEAVLQQDWPLVRQQVERGLAIAQAARQAASAGEVTAGAGLDRAAYLAAARTAEAAGDRLGAATLDSLTRWSRAHGLQQRQALGFEALLVGGWLVLALYLLVCTYKVLQGGLATLCGVLDAVGRGDLSRQPQGHGRDEIGRALNALAGSTRNMAQLFGAVTQGVAAVSHASREVAGGNAGLTNRTADVQQLVQDVTERARACSDALVSSGTQVEQAAELIRSMQADAGRSRKAMGALGEGMARLQVKSHEIGQVIGLVESLAYQTKLLSINASVEAARAGPAGRGFAVVAHEVRALAQRSEQATRRIGGIVGASIEEIRSSSTMAERAGEAVRRNDEKMARVDTLMTEAVHLTRAGRGEAQEVSLIARHVGDAMTGNVRVVDQLADASASLREQGDSLKRSVQHFVFG